MASTMTFRPVVHLKCDVQQYAWGKMGSASQVAQLRLSAQQEHAKISSAGFEVDEGKPYAELWMGSHPKAPATVVGSHLPADMPFIQYLEDNLESSLGDAITKEYDGKLPFLFKVLSISKALSIQAHPTKEHAKILHQQAPDKYPDPNHKPEMAIALTPFEAMCGFREAKDIIGFFQNIPELQTVVGKDVCDAFTADPSVATLKACFAALMHCDDEVVRQQLSQLVLRLQAQQTSGSFSAEDEAKFCASLLLRTHGQFPGDVGCFAMYFLNVINLQPGEAIFLGPNIPHAYMSGDCVECMACSDNVVRAGLTPKFKDKATLVDMLDYTMSSPSARIFRWHADGEDAPEYRVYDPPVPEFTVIHGSFDKGEHTVKPRNGPSIFLVTEGSGTVHASPDVTVPICRGSVLFVGNNVAHKLTADQPVQFYQAVCIPASS
ncbi:mannose-6-phosphate isomerase-like [Sycon ciliatum]|uniref:mannose-6-phosphate isomerase-like n=1 Tax=Sycon ciliatum TaxID=27933 RepID=UPI0031F6350C